MRSVPFHSLGISQIIAYGLLFYIFAQIKTPLAEMVGVSETAILAAVTASLLLQSVLAPIVGSWVDRFGALIVMAIGLAIGAVGMLILPLVPRIEWIWFCMLPIGVAFAMSTYEVAFSAAVQMHEARSRRNISFITFYGGVASSLTWLSVAPLLRWYGLQVVCLVVATVMMLMAWRLFILARQYTHASKDNTEKIYAPFAWGLLRYEEKRALITLALASGLEYLAFAGTSLFWISWFSIQYGVGVAVILASLYGPFQTVGRFLEMYYGHRFDARLTALVAYTFVPLAILLAMTEVFFLAVIAMIFFGMGHGILTVSFGYVTNMYFSAEIYGRAKGWISSTRGFGNAIGPTLAGVLFLMGKGWFFVSMLLIVVLSGLVFSYLVWLKPTNVDSRGESG